MSEWLASWRLATRLLQPDLYGDPAALGPAASARLGLGSRTYRHLASGPGRAPVTEAQRRAAAEALSPADDDPDPLSVLTREDVVHVERGFEDPLGGWHWALLGLLAALILVATTTATALSMGEAQRDLDTLAAVGSTPRTRRTIAAAQAGMLGLLGTLVGIAVGAVPGVALAREVTRHWGTGPFVTVPWDVLLAAVVAIPLLAAGLAALVVRSRPHLTRRPA